MNSAFRRALVLLGIATALSSSAAFASGPSLDGLSGVVRVHAADVSSPGAISGSVYGLYARSRYTAEQSARGTPEIVKFGGSALSLAYAPTPTVELALRGEFEGQAVTPGVGESESQIGLGMFAFGVKTLLTPADRTTWKLAAEVGAGTSAGDANALVGSWDPNGFDILGRLALTFTQPREDRAPAVRAHANAGFLSRTGEFDEVLWAATAAGATPGRDVLHGDQFLYGAALEVPVPHRFTVFTEWSGEYDVNADAPLSDNPMRVTPGVRWAGKGGGFVATAGWEISVASDESGPGSQLVAGLSFGGYMTPASGNVVGVVRDAATGEPISGARVLARGGSADPAISDARGRFVANLQEGYVVLDLVAAGYEPKTRVVEVKGHDEIAFDVMLAAHNPFGTVQGRVQDGVSGAPIAARARVAGQETWVDSDPETGIYILENVPEGIPAIEFEARSFVNWSTEARVVAGQSTPLDATLERDENYLVGEFAGVVKDAISGAPIDATILVGAPASRTITADSATGEFQLELDSGSYSLTIARAGYLSKTETVRILERQSQVREIVLTPLPSSLAMDGALFDSGSATIKRESLVTLDEAGKFLLENPDVRVVIRGHQDPSATELETGELAQRRADAVMKYLVVSYGIDPVRLRAVASEEQAASPGSVELKVETEGEAD